MSALTLPIADRLGKLIPRLASNHDGEALATVRAIERTLKSAGLDWHDLAATLIRGPASQQHTNSSDPEDATAWVHKPHWVLLSHEQRLAWMQVVLADTWCSDWERKFITDMAARTAADPNSWVSPKQRSALDRIFLTAWHRGARI